LRPQTEAGHDRRSRAGPAGAAMIQRFVETYGFWAVLLGTAVEGETVMVMAGFLAHRGYLALWVVVAAGFAGSLLADQLFFHLGRRWGAQALERRPAWRGHAERLRPLLERRGTLVILGFRFWLGMRTVIPLALGGTTDIGAARFFALNAVGALAWSAVVGGLGYACGHAIEAALDRVEAYEHLVLIAVALAGATFWLLHAHRRRGRASAVTTLPRKTP
jgi:membrane protein DedA with SNARE-associated domain